MRGLSKCPVQIMLYVCPVSKMAMWLNVEAKEGEEGLVERRWEDYERWRIWRRECALVAR